MQLVETDEKTGIMYKRWNSPAPKAIFLLVHGLGAHTGRWDNLAEFFLQNSISSYALELKGFGETKDLKGHIDTLDTYSADILALREIIKKENKEGKVFLLGESMGALISFLVAAGKPAGFAGLICISPSFKSKLKFSPLTQIRIFFSLFYNHKKYFSLPFNSQMCTQDAELQKKIDSDPRENRLVTAKLLVSILAAQLRAKILTGKIRIPVLFLLSGRDMLVDPEESKKIFRALKAEDKAMIEYSEMYHVLSLDLGKEKVFSDILTWLQSRY